jgi:hypothetical protein
MKNLWAQHTDKNSGSGKKNFGYDIRVVTWTDQGYREVTALKYNEQLKMIELELDNE